MNAESFLIGTTMHSALGKRWVYDGCGDVVYLTALAATILHGGREAALDVLTDRDEPFHAAEIVREKLTLKLREELPYGINVQIERFADENNRIMINAVIWVERAGQKAIVIGQGGERLKEIGRLARIELNDLWQRSVHLELWVKVKENWADSEMALRQFGYDTL